MLTHPLGYVLKPFNRQDLRVALKLVLSRHQSGAELNAESSTESPDLPSAEAESPQSGLPPSKLKKALSYIDSHLNQSLSLERLADEVGISAHYFARLFKLSTGKSVHQYVIHQRVERAKQLLKQSEQTIAEIAIDCGFANSSHLALHFKQIVGVLPKKFRYLN